MDTHTAYYLIAGALILVGLLGTVLPVLPGLPLMFAGMHVTFLPMHLTGFMGMPRRVYTYLPGAELTVTNALSTLGAFILAGGVAVFLADLARNFRFTTKNDAGNTYGGGTLEWLPTGLYSTRSIPVVDSRYPLWDDPDLCRNVEEGRYFLPGAPTGNRETLITSPVRAEPEYLQIMPGPSVWPLLSAVTTAGFFLLLTIEAYTPAIVSGILSVVCVLRWIWETDRPVSAAEVDVGAGIMLPTYVTGPRTHGWWAMVILLIVIFMLFLMTLFSYLYLFGVQPDFWKTPPALSTAGPVLAIYAMAAGLALLGRRLLAREKSTLWSPSTASITGALLLLPALGADYLSLSSRLDPELSGQGAVAHAFLVNQLMLAVIAALMAAFLAGRTARKLVTRPRNNTVDLVTLFVIYTAVQGTAATLIVRLVTGAG